jgi:hypothetical protein
MLTLSLMGLGALCGVAIYVTLLRRFKERAHHTAMFIFAALFVTLSLLEVLLIATSCWVGRGSVFGCTAREVLEFEPSTAFKYLAALSVYAFFVAGVACAAHGSLLKVRGNSAR